MQENKLKYVDTKILVNIFKDISDCLEFIKSFSFGHIFDTNKQADLEYPHLFLELPSAYEWSVRPSRKEITFAIQVFTRVREGKGGQTVDVETLDSFANEIAKMEYALEEALSLFKFNYNKNIKSDQTFNALPLTEAYEDSVYGLRCEINLGVPTGIDSCDIIYSDAECGPVIIPGGGPGTISPCPEACLSLIDAISLEVTELISDVEDLANRVAQNESNIINIVGEINNLQTQITQNSDDIIILQNEIANLEGGSNSIARDISNAQLFADKAFIKINEGTGNTTTSGYTTSTPQIFAFPFSLTADFELDAFTVFINSFDDTVSTPVFQITDSYEDTTNRPRTVLAQGTATGLGLGGIFTQTFAPVTLTAGKLYYFLSCSEGANSLSLYGQIATNPGQHLFNNVLTQNFATCLRLNSVASTSYTNTANWLPLMRTSQPFLPIAYIVGE